MVALKSHTAGRWEGFSAYSDTVPLYRSRPTIRGNFWCDHKYAEPAEDGSKT